METCLEPLVPGVSAASAPEGSPEPSDSSEEGAWPSQSWVGACLAKDASEHDRARVLLGVLGLTAFGLATTGSVVRTHEAPGVVRLVLEVLVWPVATVVAPLLTTPALWLVLALLGDGLTLRRLHGAICRSYAWIGAVLSALALVLGLYAFTGAAFCWIFQVGVLLYGAACLGGALQLSLDVWGALRSPWSRAGLAVAVHFIYLMVMGGYAWTKLQRGVLL